MNGLLNGFRRFRKEDLSLGAEWRKKMIYRERQKETFPVYLHLFTAAVSVYT